jgi:hypothetical protein
MRNPTIAAVTCVAFLFAMIWPEVVRAQAAQPQASAPGAAPPAPAPSSEDPAMQAARQHFEGGRNAYNAGDYPAAIREFKAAEQLRPSPILDYNVGLANEKLGKRRVAVKYYRRYLELQPNAANKPEVEQRIATLEQEIAAQPPPAAGSVPGGTAPQPNAAAPGGVEQPGEMPPAQAPAPPRYGYDPYASYPPPAPAYVPTYKPPKKKSRWWIGLVVAGGIVVIAVPIIVIAVVASNASNQISTSSPVQQPLPPINSSTAAPSPANLTLFRF